jgi:tetratricopeptide (TPR) repeat protein
VDAPGERLDAYLAARLPDLSRSRIQGLSRWSGDPPLARIDGDTAREAARRATARAVLLPVLYRLGGSYVVEVRAEAPVDGATLFSARETTSSKEGIVPALDRISDRVRRELGEPAGDIEAARIQVGRLDGRSLEAYDLWLRAADVLAQYGEVGEARRLLLRAVEIDPDFALTRFALADLALITNEPEEAAPHLAAARRSLERLPDRERLLLELLLAAGDGAPGQDLERRARSLVDRFPNDKLLLLNAAQVHWRTLGDRPTAEALYRRGLALDPGLMCMAIDLVNLLGEEGRTGEAVSVARRAMAERPSAPNKTILAMALAADGALAEAVDWARDAIRVAGGKSFYVTTFATEILARGDAPDEAAAEYRRVAATSDYEGERRMATLGLVGLLAIQGRVAEAHRAARDPRALPTRIRASPAAMSFLAGTGFPRLAAPRALEAVRTAPASEITAAMLAFHGDLGGAAEAGKALVPESRGWTFLRALQAGAAGRTDDAVDAFRSLAHPARDGRRHQFLYLAGEALLEAGRPADAIEVLRPAVGTAMPLYGPLDVAANYPRAVLVRARAYEKLGRNADGLAEVNRLLKQWARADADLPLVVEARALQARLAIAP